jgi:predicted S18 family serine protease
LRFGRDWPGYHQIVRHGLPSDRIVPIGGLKEKTLAAHRGGIKTFVLPKRNAKDLAELPEVVKTELELVQVSSLGGAGGGADTDWR